MVNGHNFYIITIRYSYSTSVPKMTYRNDRQPDENRMILLTVVLMISEDDQPLSLEQLLSRVTSNGLAFSVPSYTYFLTLVA